MTWYHLALDGLLVSAVLYQGWLITRLQLEVYAWRRAAHDLEDL